LKDFLAKYGKQVDGEREDKKRLGMTQKDSAAGICKDYDLPLTPDQYIKEITPMYREKYVFSFLFSFSHQIKFSHKLYMLLFISVIVD
jgi:hypothetical protein